MRKDTKFQIEFMNQNVNRRIFASGSAAAVAGSSMLSLSNKAQAQNGTPHFLLMMCVSGGLDTAYMFDARPLAMTDKGKIQNYLYKNADSSVVLPADPNPIVMTGTNGGKTLRTSLMDPLMKYQSDFTVVNGVGMDPNGFVGHGNNMYYLFTNSPNPGRDSWLPYIGATSGSPLEYVHIGGFEGDGNQAPTNFSGSIQLLPGQGGNLANALKNGPQIDMQSALMKQVFGRINANAAGAGIFSKGAGKMGAGLAKAPELAETLKKVASGQGGSGEFASALDLAIAYFRGGVTSTATIMYDRDPVLDTHGASSAQKQPELFKEVIADMELLFKTLKETPFDANAGLSFFDVTTVVITSEFSRTMRQNGSNIDNTGTDHNPLTNSVILAGKGINGGQVIGASDHENVDDAGEFLNVSEAHKLKDPQMLNIMGRPFDFATGTPRADLPTTYDMKDYLLFPSIANTLMELFKVPSQKHFRIGSDNAPIVKTLLK